MKYIIRSLPLLLAALCITSTVYAQADTPTLVPGSGSNFYGTIELPEYLQAFADAGEVQGGGLVIIFNMFLRLILVIAGFLAIWKFIAAGFSFMNSGGDPESIGHARDQIVFTILGLLVMASALVLAGIIGIIFYKNPTAIISPQLIGAPTPTP